MIIEKGSKLLVVHRRLFELDEPRLFLGTVEEYDGGLAKITGYTWFRSPLDDTPTQKEGMRTKIISLAAGTLLIYSLPEEIDLESAKFDVSNDGRLLLRADPNYVLDLSESHFRRTERKAA
jgi:hypothetical protein